MNRFLITLHTLLLLLSVFDASAASDAQLYLRISEIMYSPLPPSGGTNVASDFEFVEFVNTSSNVTLSLTGCAITNGVAFTFTSGTLMPGAHTSVVRNADAFTNRYGPVGFAGVYTGGIKDGGELIEVGDALGQLVHSCNITNAWYPTTAANGFSLVARDERQPGTEWSKKSQWKVSANMHGNPGVADPGTNIPAIVMNEALTHTDPPQVDSIELHNTTTKHREHRRLVSFGRHR